MKKFCIILSTVILLVGAVLCAAACTSTPQEEDNHISYMQQSFFWGKNKDFEARLVVGTAETMFVADGKTVEVVPFATLTIVPLHVDLFNETYEYTLTGISGNGEGKLDKDSFGATYSAALHDLDRLGTPQTVTIKSTKIEATIELENMLANSITGVTALETAEKQLADKLAADNKEREIYVKYINDADNDKSAYYWYVAFIASPTDYYAVLVDDKGQVVSVNP